MSTWRVKEEPPPSDYLQLLYADNEEQLSESDLSDGKDDEWDSRSPTPDSTLSTSLTWPQLSGDREERFRDFTRERSRSPIWLHQPYETAQRGEVVQIFDEYGMPLQVEDVTETDESVGLDQDIFLTADAHSVYVYPVKNDGVKRNLRERGRSGRRGGRGIRRGQSARCLRQNQRLKEDQQWRVGHPLHEIWLSDEDIPAKLVCMLRDIIKSRESRIRERLEGERDRPERDNEDDDDFFDASDDTSGIFEWSPMESFQGKEERFLRKRTGATKVHHSAYDAFRSYWDDDILDVIVSETNKYVNNFESTLFQQQWNPTNKHEILCLFSFWMMLGIIRMPTVISCFSTDPLLKTDVFPRIFTRKRYEYLTRALHFIESHTARNDTNQLNTDAAKSVDPLYRLRPIILHLNAKFQSNYILDKDICIDESLTLWKGRLDIKQYIPSKASKFGIKTFELCESVTGYLWSFIVYTGKRSVDLEQAPNDLKSTSIVKNLMAPLLNKGYRLFMDNWYNSPLLARFLKRNGTDCVGTLRPSRRDVPVLINKAPLKRGEIIARHSGDVTVLAWQDKRRVTMISTCHDSSTALPRVASRSLSRPVPYKPQVVLDYNKFMGGVDLKDQMLEPYLLERKRCSKWYMKLFKRLLNVSILNSRILLQSSAQTSHDHLAFRLQLVDSILTNHLLHCPQSRRFAASISRAQRQGICRRIPGAHWPTLLDKTGGSIAGNRNSRKRCVVCLREGRKTSKTTFTCETCQVPLCIIGCFKSYHLS